MRVVPDSSRWRGDDREQSVLGSILLDESVMADLPPLRANDFEHPAHQLIFSAIQERARKSLPVDAASVAEHLELSGLSDQTGGVKYLHDLAMSVVSPLNAGGYAKLVLDASNERRNARARDRVKRILEEESDDWAHKLQDYLSSECSRDDANDWQLALRQWSPRSDLSTFVPQVEFAVSGLIQRGKVGALVAAGGTGKTTLLLTLGICIALGRPFFGCTVRQGSFVLLSNDDSQEDLDAALALVGRALRLSEEEWSIVAQKFRLVSLQGRNGLKTFTGTIGGAVLATGLERSVLKAVEKIPDLVGIALDTLRQFSGGNSNDEQVIKLTISGATEIANKTGAFVVFPHHTGKQNYRDAVADMYCGSGSAAIADNCRFVLLLQTATWPEIEMKVRRTGLEHGAPLVLTSTRGSLLVPAPEPIYLHRDGFLIERIQGDVMSGAQVADERDRAILNAVRQGAQTKNAIAATVRGKRTAVLSQVDQLEARGFLTRGSHDGSQKLMVTALGAKLLDE